MRRPRHDHFWLLCAMLGSSRPTCARSARWRGSRRPRLPASTRADLPRLISTGCASSRLKAGDRLRSPASSASVARLFIGLWRADAHSGDFRFSTRITSRDFNGSSPSQSRHRNFRPPAFTSVHRMGLLHLRQRGGGRFLTTMMLTLNWAGARNSQSPITGLGWAVMDAA